MKKIFCISVLFLVLSGSMAIGAESVAFLKPDAADLLPSTLSAETAKSLPNLSQDAVSYAWAVTPDTKIDTHPAAFVATSREYLLRVDSKALQSGIELPTTAPGALIRLNPAGSTKLGKALTINPQTIVLKTPMGEILENGHGMLSLADSEALKSAGAPFAEGTSAFRLDPALGSGRFTLAVPEAASNGEAGWVIHVLEKDSLIALSAQTNRSAYLTGQRLHATFTLEGANSIDMVKAELHSPSGAAHSLRVARQGENTFQIITSLDFAELSEGLWEIHAAVRGGTAKGTVLRDVHTAFAVSAPTATFLGRANVVMDDQISIELPVEVAAQGRYAAQAVLFGTGEDGTLHAIATCQSADMLAAGVSSLTLSFDSSLIRSSGLHAPYEIRDLQLMDQGRMGQLYRQGRALLLQ